MSIAAELPLRLVPERVLGGLEREAAETPLPGATWYTAQRVGDGLAYRFPAGALAAARYLTADLLLDGNHLAVFQLTLREGDEGPTFRLSFGLLNQCAARMRVPLEAVSQNRWRYEREGAWLKPICGGERVDLRKVDHMTVAVLRKSDRPVRWCLTPVTATAEEPPRLTEPILPKGPLLDELGQSTLHEWPAKSRSPEEVTARLVAQLAAAPAQRWPARFSRWGGWTGRRLEATGYFRTHHDGRRWWLVDPDGYIFWSAGLDCVRLDTEASYAGLEAALSWLPDPGGRYMAIYGRETINYLAANLIRAFGPEAYYARWAEIVLAELRRLGFNTVGNWSAWRIARAAGFPYVRPLNLRFPKTPLIYRDFPDVFHPAFADDAAAFAEQLRETVGDPAMIGYFLTNEPTWGFAQETPAAGMLFASPACVTRQALGDFLRERYGSDGALAAAWGSETSLASVAEGAWSAPLTQAARGDLAAFSSLMVEKLFTGLSDACRAVDPNHLNLGVRYASVRETSMWAVERLRCFDVFSVNCYDQRVRAEVFERVSTLLDRPILVGEWHFGALDAGLPASGIGHVRDQAARGQAFRVYTEDAAAKPWCVGVHYFQCYDQSALGRFDGENYNIGFLDVCNRPYEPLAGAARASHERVYQVALGQVEPFSEQPEYLPRVFV
jgi:hypothetical protein